MRDTPRVFVGTVTLCLDGPHDAGLAGAIVDQLARLVGVRLSSYDAAAGTVSVTADVPVDRADVEAAVERAGCRIR